MVGVVIQIETLGSMWFIDEDQKRYLRMPKTEGPRAPGWWELPEPGDPLNDLEWHSMVDWQIAPSDLGQMILYIEYESKDGNPKVLIAPDAEIIHS